MGSRSPISQEFRPTRTLRKDSKQSNHDRAADIGRQKQANSRRLSGATPLPAAGVRTTVDVYGLAGHLTRPCQIQNRLNNVLHLRNRFHRLPDR